MVDTKNDTSTLEATFGAGCFWGVEAAFRKLHGVTKTRVGYMGGKKYQPTYDDVCTDLTGHAEVVRIEFNPLQMTYHELLAIFWEIHDPTQLNRQGPDFGSQYRTVIFYHNDEQKKVATSTLNELQTANKYAGRPVVTTIEPAAHFWPAEDYHQQYLEKRGLASCHVSLQ